MKPLCFESRAKSCNFQTIPPRQVGSAYSDLQENGGQLDTRKSLKRCKKQMRNQIQLPLALQPRRVLELVTNQAKAKRYIFIIQSGHTSYPPINGSTNMILYCVMQTIRRAPLLCDANHTKRHTLFHSCLEYFSWLRDHPWPSSNQALMNLVSISKDSLRHCVDAGCWLS